MNGHDISLILYAFAHKGFRPREVLNFSLDASRAQSGGEHNQMFVAGKGSVHHFGKFPSWSSRFVDGDEEGSDACEIHKEIVGQIANASVIVSSEDSTKYHTIGTAQGVVAYKGEAATIGIRRKML